MLWASCALSVAPDVRSSDSSLVSSATVLALVLS